MGYKVEKSFDFAEFSIDYKKKKVDLSYPHKSHPLMDFIIFILFGIPFVALFYVIFGSFLFWIPEQYQQIYGIMVLTIPVGTWMWFCYRTKYVREFLIKIGQDSNQENQIYLGGYIGKKIIIQNVGNYFTGYETFGDHSLYLEKFEIKNRKRIKKKKKLFHQPHYRWEIHVTFSKRPKDGHMIIKNQRSEFDETIGNGDIIIKSADK